MCKEGNKPNNLISDHNRTGFSIFKMETPSRTSPFWLNFDTLRRRKTQTSMWNKFSSPYDLPRTALHSLSSPLPPGALPRPARATRPSPPASLFLSSPSLKPKKWDAAEEEMEAGLARRKLRASRSVEVLDDVPDSAEAGRWGPWRRRISEISRSTDELEEVRNQWLQRLEQCKITKSDESLSLGSRHLGPSAVDGLLLVKGQPNRFYSLSRIKVRDFWGTESPEDRAVAAGKDCRKPETGRCRDGASSRSYRKARVPSSSFGNDVEEEGGEEEEGGGGGEEGAAVFRETNDRLLLTVRPGFRLGRSRSCGSRTRKCAVSSSSYSHREALFRRPRKASVSFNLEDLAGSHLESPEREEEEEEEEENLPVDQVSWAPPPPPPGIGKHDLGRRPRGPGDPWRPSSEGRRLLRSSSSPRSRTGGDDDGGAEGPRRSRRDGFLAPAAGRDWRAAPLVSEDESGFCRGIIFDGSTSARTGLFPASLVARRRPQQRGEVGGMSGRAGKPTAAVKVSPPTVPDSAGVSHRHSGSSFSSGVYSAGGDQRSSYSSSVSDENPPPSPRSPARGGCDHGQLGRLGTTTGGGNNNNNSSSTNNSSGGSPTHYHNNNNNSSSNNQQQQQQQFTFPAAPHQQQMPQFAHLMCPKTSPGSPHHVPPDGTYTYLTYQHQTSLEDQGIDVQSPGRSSPGSGSGSSTTGSTASSSGGCRNSTTSLDSGRASTTTQSHQHRLSGQSYDSGSILRHSYHSSSSSLGSMEHDAAAAAAAAHVNVPELLNNGVRDSEVLRVWLTDLRFEEYYEKFISAGYDMPTISRMTPEDLNAIGITKPAHRKKLKAEITRLNISDGLPDFIPNRLEDWLSMLRLEEYTTSLKQQNYTSVEQMTQLTWEDLEDIGITKLGHQKKVMLAIKRAKDIMAGKKFTSSQDPRQQSLYGTHEIMISRESSEGRDQYTSVPEFHTFAGSGHYGNGEHNRLSGPADSGVHYGVPTHYAPGVQYGPVPPPQAHVHPMPQHPGPFHPSGQFNAPQGPSPPGSKLPNVPPHPLLGSSQVQYRPDVVAVQVRSSGRGRSIESLEEPIYGTYQTFHPESRLPVVQGPMSLGSLPPRPFPPTTVGSSHPQRSMDDGDITPTNEYANNYEGGGTLPRPRTANKLRPVAKVTAKTRVDIHEVPQFIKDGMNLKKPSQPEEIGMKELNLKTLNRQNSEKMYNSSQGTGSTNNTPQGTPKKIPPPPPRRSNSISETSKEAASQESQYAYLRRGLSYGYMGIKNNLQPDVTPDLPPPPAPPDSANHQHLPDDFPPPPPPLTCVTMASSTRISASSTITTSSITSDSMTTSQTSTTSSEDDVSSGFRPRRNDSNASFKSTSSTDSESLPFANENAGTIKQRACRPHPGLSVLDTRNSPHSSPRSSPALRRKEVQAPLRPNPVAAIDSSTGQLTKSNSSSPDGTGDVLNDIGNMLANLTDELDAMLEQEVILKN